MEPILHTTSLFSSTAVSGLFSAIWEGSILALCTAVCLRLMPRLSAAARSLVWLNVFLLLVLLHIVPSLRERIGAGMPEHASPVYLAPGWSLAIAALWATLSLWRATGLALSAVRLHRMARRATPVHVDETIQSVIRGEESGRAAELCVSDEVERPSVFGFFRPRILLPSGLIERLSASELQQVVVHEMEHLRRRDDWTNLLQKIGLMLFPLNPVLFWAERRLCIERELACDDRVLRSSCARKAYALCLTRLAEDSMLRRSLSLALGAWERRPELVLRVQRLLRRPSEAMGSRQAKLVTAGLILGVLGSAAVLARSPQLVSFAPLSPATMLVRTPSIAYLPEAGSREPNLQDQGGSVQLVKAVMPQPAQPAPKARTTQIKAVKHIVKQRAVQARQAWVVLTEWSDTEPPPHIVFAVDPVNRNSYAAVPVANGWVIFQI
ncbi:MAG: M56 family metallopeptidase [Terracidiphilus sp.]|jgi:beta-lactamase regulating signal transducer with metallopeptidase domain